MTYPLIGNYGRLFADDQSERPWLRALVVANATAAVVEKAAQLAALLRDQSIPAIAGVDTRALARHLRTHGSIPGLVTAPGEMDPAAAVAAARALPRWEDQDFVGLVSPEAAREVGERRPGRPAVGIVDHGLKANIVRSLRRRGARVRILPHTVVDRRRTGRRYRWAGPLAGARRPVAARRPGRAGASRDRRRPTVARHLPRPPDRGRAAGADTRRLRFGHHGANHPVRDVDTGLVQVTAQNHEVQVVAETLPRDGGFHVSQVNLNDGSVEGLRHRELPIETVQYHPEGAPGPLDALAVFDRFVAACAKRP